MKNTAYCLVVLSLFISVSVFAQDTKTVTAEGVASIGTDPAAARDKAVEDALRRAVEQAVGTMVESETQVENYQLLSDRIYSRSSGYVTKYDILSETRDGNLLRVQISAQVNSGNLNNDLAAVGLLQRRMKYPRVMVMIAEDNILKSDFWEVYSVSNSQSEASMIMKLKAKGFNVVEPNLLRKTVSGNDARAAWEGNSEIAGSLGTKLGAEIVIIGKATSTRAAANIYGSDMLSMSTTMTAMAVKAGTGEIIAQGSGQANAAHINEVAALQESIRKASDKMGDDIIAGIIKHWQTETSGTRNLVIQLQDISPGELEKVKSVFSGLRGVADVLVRNFSEGSADLDIQAKTDAQDLSASIGKAKFTGFRLVLVDSSMDRLTYRIVH